MQGPPPALSSVHQRHSAELCRVPLLQRCPGPRQALPFRGRWHSIYAHSCCCLENACSHPCTPSAHAPPSQATLQPCQCSVVGTRARSPPVPSKPRHLSNRPSALELRGASKPAARSRVAWAPQSAQDESETACETQPPCVYCSTHGEAAAAFLLELAELAKHGLALHMARVPPVTLSLVKAWHLAGTSEAEEDAYDKGNRAERPLHSAWRIRGLGRAFRDLQLLVSDQIPSL